MEPEVIASVLIAGVVFLGIVALLWRNQTAPTQEGENKFSSPNGGVITTSMDTSHVATPLFLAYKNGEQENPSEETIVAALSELHAHSDDTVTLDDPDLSGSYLQTYREADGSFCVEYYEGATYRHSRAEPNPDLALTQILFMLFNLRKWDVLKQAVVWRDVTN